MQCKFCVGLNAIRHKCVRIKDAAGAYVHISDVDESDYANHSASQQWIA